MQKLIIVEGIIGAGKSTLVNILHEHLTSKGLKCLILSEPVDDWVKDGHLEDFYGDMKRNSYFFQTITFVSKMEILFNAYNDKTIDVFISDRSIFSDHFFVDVLNEEGNMTDKEHKVYYKWWNLWNSVNPAVPHFFIYLSPSVTKCIERIRKRNRNEELSITENYQTKLKEKHDRFFNKDFVMVFNNKIPCMKIVSDKDFENNIDVSNEICDNIYNTLF